MSTQHAQTRTNVSLSRRTVTVCERMRVGIPACGTFEAGIEVSRPRPQVAAWRLA